MSISMKKPIVLLEYKYSKNIVTEGYNNELLDESLHTFNQQHELAEYIAGFAVEGVKLNKKSCIVDIKRFNLPLKKVVLIIKKENLINRVSAQINDIDTDGNAKLFLNMYIHVGMIVSENEKIVFNETKEAIMHEFGHWYFILTKYNNSGSIDTTSSNPLYLEIQDIMKNPNISQELYYFLYSLYAVFGNELNAFVSQYYSEVYNYLMEQKELTIKSVRKALLRSNIYDTFITNINNLEHVIELNDYEKENLISEFNSNTNNKENNIKDVKKLNKMLKFALERNNEALRFCEQTAVNAYYKLKNK